MKGSMDDLPGRVWTWLASQDGVRNIMEIMIGVRHNVHNDILTALQFWENENELLTFHSPTGKEYCIARVRIIHDPYGSAIIGFENSRVKLLNNRTRLSSVERFNKRMSKNYRNKTSRGKHARR